MPWTVYAAPEGDSAWIAEALCRGADPDLFFPKREDGSDTQPAKDICARCPVRDACLEYAMVNRIEYGVWGGLSERQRVNLRRRQRYLERQEEVAAS